MNFSARNCGDKEFLERHGLKILNLDVSFHPKMKLIADGHNIPLKNDCIEDGVVSLSALEHLYDPNKAIKEIFRALKTEWVFFGSVVF